MGVIVINVTKWDDYNPKNAKAKNWSWFRFDFSFFTHPDFVEVPAAEKWMWPYILGECCKKKRGTDIRLNTRLMGGVLNLSEDQVLWMFDWLAAQEMIEITEPSEKTGKILEKSVPSVDPNPGQDFQKKTPLRYEHNTTEQIYINTSGNPQAGRQQSLAIVPNDPPSGGCKNKKNYKFSDWDMKTAQSLFDFVKGNPRAERIHEANLEAWANEFRLLRETGPTEGQIRAVLHWALITQVWERSIQSPSGIRRNWESLVKEFQKARKENRYI